MAEEVEADTGWLGMPTEPVRRSLPSCDSQWGAADSQGRSGSVGSERLSSLEWFSVNEASGRFAVQLWVLAGRGSGVFWERVGWIEEGFLRGWYVEVVLGVFEVPLHRQVLYHDTWERRC